MAEDTAAAHADRTTSEFRKIADQLRGRVDLFGKTWQQSRRSGPLR